MSSPFPGMDPYLEPHWLDVHTKLVTYAADALNGRLPDDLIASTEERVAVESKGGEEHVYGPDVRIFEMPGDEPSFVETGGGTATATTVGTLPYRLLSQVEPIIERYIRVIDARTERMVTVIEFVSPTNKHGEGLYAFRAKRAALVASGVNFVEIDLVRAGDWKALLRPHSCPKKALSLYRATVRIPGEPSIVYLQPISVRESLPELPIPLRKDDPQIRIALQPLLDQAYVNGRYARRLDYAKPLDPPLEGEDAAWVAERLKGRT